MKEQDEKEQDEKEQDEENELKFHSHEDSWNRIEM